VGAKRHTLPAVGLVASVVVPALVAGGLAASFSSPGDEARGAPVATDSGAANRAAVAPAPRNRARTRGARPARPIHISIPTAGSSGPVDRIGVDDGALEIPPPGRAGWFDQGPRPGDLGRAVVVSHVDSREGPALFANLLTLKRGARIRVRDRRGTMHRFAVVRRRQVEKSRFAASMV